MNFSFCIIILLLYNIHVQENDRKSSENFKNCPGSTFFKLAGLGAGLIPEYSPSLLSLL